MFTFLPALRYVYLPKLKEHFMSSLLSTKPRVLITGSARGLGLQIAQMLNGTYGLVLSSRLERTEFEKAIFNSPVEFEDYLRLDFSEEPTDFVRSMETMREVDVLIHNASPYTEEQFFNTSNADIIAFGKFSINSTLFIRNIKLTGLKKILIIGSSSADPDFKAYAGGALYGTYKSSLQSLARALIKETQLNMITINPGLISNEDPCPDNAVSSSKVLETIRIALETTKHDRKIVPIYPSVQFLS